jgi:hypothetical protein
MVMSPGGTRLKMGTEGYDNNLLSARRLETGGRPAEA